jgi:hypothetical protein
MSSPFLPYANTTLRFQVFTGSLVPDLSGNLRPGTGIVEVGALMSQKQEGFALKVIRESRPGVDALQISIAGFITSIAGQDSLILPSIITVNSICAAVWQGRSGRFFMDFTARNPYVAAIGIDIVENIKGYFQPANFSVEGDPFVVPPPTPTPIPGAIDFELKFAQADLDGANQIRVPHNLGTRPSAIALWDGSGNLVTPDNIQYLDLNNLAIDLTSFVSIQGTWTISIGV